ncbi:FadR/GntR family transcriptional regulator [Pseudovibrio flavus]|uniref:FadR/GntR family transcriptional regulator n=1 Tax=Pseudovibrio flavus TaxID=2529854 RepID=UPI00211BB91D|nr:FadR/GntR family transcriptional regulator [Pseudovibrio flavus]
MFELNESFGGKINKQSLSEQTADQLRAEIQRQKLTVGSELPGEIKIAESLGVSRSVVREALRVLAAEGMIELRNGKKPIVSHMNSEVIGRFLSHGLASAQITTQEVSEYRILVESALARLAALRRNDSQIVEMKQCVEEMAENQRDLEKFADADLKLHLIIAQAANNTIFNVLQESASNLIHDGITHGNNANADFIKPSEVVEMHRAIVAAIEAGDPTEAEAAMKRSFQYFVTAEDFKL